MKKLYSENEDFKTYVDKYCQIRKVSIEEALSHATVREVANYYRGLNNGKKNS